MQTGRWHQKAIVPALFLVCGTIVLGVGYKLNSSLSEHVRQMDEALFAIDAIESKLANLSQSSAGGQVTGAQEGGYAKVEGARLAGIDVSGIVSELVYLRAQLVKLEAAQSAPGEEGSRKIEYQSTEGFVQPEVADVSAAREERLARLDSFHSAAEVDVKATMMLETKISETVSQLPEPRVVVDNFSCTNEMCRLAVVGGEPVARADFLMRFPAIIGGTMATEAYQSGETLIVYFNQTGKDFPL